ncbi:hypothetical protein D3C81_1508490 [compost metagenome]
MFDSVAVDVSSAGSSEIGGVDSEFGSEVFKQALTECWQIHVIKHIFRVHVDQKEHVPIGKKFDVAIKLIEIEPIFGNVLLQVQHHKNFNTTVSVWECFFICRNLGCDLCTIVHQSGYDSEVELISHLNKNLVAEQKAKVVC